MGSPNLPPLPPDPTPIPTGEVLGNMRAQLASLKGTDFQTQAENLDKALADATPGALSLARDFDFANALNSLSLVMPGVTSGVLLAVEGFSDGDTLVGVQGVMDLCASVVPAVGVVVGAGIGAATTQPQVGAGVGYVVGAIIGSIFTMISDILGFFAPKTESVA